MGHVDFVERHTCKSPLNHEGLGISIFFDFQPGESTLLGLQRGDRIWEARVANAALVP
jgi:hypothetical protein